MPYKFAYSVNDKYSYNDYSHQEANDGKAVKGEYRVALPDGRTQIVSYYVEGDSGFVATVRYEGQASYPDKPSAVYPSTYSSTSPPYSPDKQGISKPPYIANEHFDYAKFAPNILTGKNLGNSPVSPTKTRAPDYTRYSSTVDDSGSTGDLKKSQYVNPFSGLPENSRPEKAVPEKEVVLYDLPNRPHEGYPLKAQQLQENQLSKSLDRLRNVEPSKAYHGSGGIVRPDQYDPRYNRAPHTILHSEVENPYYIRPDHDQSGPRYNLLPQPNLHPEVKIFDRVRPIKSELREGYIVNPGSDGVRNGNVEIEQQRYLEKTPAPHYNNYRTENPKPHDGYSMETESGTNKKSVTFDNTNIRSEPDNRVLKKRPHQGYPDNKPQPYDLEDGRTLTSNGANSAKPKQPHEGYPTKTEDHAPYGLKEKPGNTQRITSRPDDEHWQTKPALHDSSRAKFEPSHLKAERLLPSSSQRNEPLQADQQRNDHRSTDAKNSPNEAPSTNGEVHRREHDGYTAHKDPVRNYQLLRDSRIPLAYVDRVRESQRYIPDEYALYYSPLTGYYHHVSDLPPIPPSPQKEYLTTDSRSAHRRQGNPIPNQNQGAAYYYERRYTDRDSSLPYYKYYHSPSQLIINDHSKDYLPAGENYRTHIESNQREQLSGVRPRNNPFSAVAVSPK